MVIILLAVLIVAAAVIFSAQNALPVTVSFIVWKFSASLAIVVFLAVLAGMVIMGLLWMGSGLRKSMKKGAKAPDVAAAGKGSASVKETVKAP